MIETFRTFDPMLQVYWVAALVATLIFLIQAVLTFVGFDSDSDFSGGDTSFDADGFSLISVKTIVCFVLGFGWTGVLFFHSIASPLTLGLMATGVGLLFMVLIALLLRQMMKLTRNNTFSPLQAVGLVGEVYLRVPAGQKDTGKVVVSVEGSMHELLALTADDEDLPTGSQVRIVGTVSSDTVLVQRLG
jgi:membrane protein implicated in regulation of membrane protease activity